MKLNGGMNRFKKILENSTVEIKSNVKFIINEFICDNNISFNELYEIISTILKENFTKEDLKTNIYPGTFN